MASDQSDTVVSTISQVLLSTVANKKRKVNQCSKKRYANFLFHNHDTRNRDNLHLVRCKTSYGLRSVKYKGSNLWNQLPNDLKVIASLNSFKSKLKFTLATSHI